MSCQLIYTSAARLLTPSLSGYDVVARSAGIPRQLADKLCALSKAPENDGPNSPASLFSYRIVECASGTWHVLSSICNDVTDYSGRRCHLAHHLALTGDEMAALRRNSARPTPAGIILALMKESFWCTRWEGEPRLLDAEPRLTAASLPNASQQDVWKALTGHKSNAKCFFTPPYEQSCLVIVPEGIRAQQCLMLLHESDWLAPRRGWSNSFCTPGFPEETTAGIRRVCLRPGTPQEARARSTGLPCLTINDSLSLPPPPPPAAADKSERAAHPLGYSYAESADAVIYTTPPGHRHHRRYLLCTSILFALGVGMYLGASDQADEIGGATRAAIRYFSTGENLAELRNLLDAPYAAETSRQRLESLRARIDSAQAESATAAELKSCVDTLCLAGSSPHRLAAAPQQLMLHARQLKLPEESLLSLALCLATQGQDVEGWRRMLSPEARQAWAELLTREHLVSKWRSDARLAVFVRELLPPPAPEESADAGSAPPALEQAADPHPIPSLLRPRSLPGGTTVAALAGQPAPAELLQALAHVPLVLEQGSFSLCRWETQGPPSAALNMELSPGQGSLRLEAGNEAGEYFLRPAADSGQDWELLLRVEDGALTDISEGGKPVALKLPLPANGDALCELLLLPRVNIALEPLSLPAPLEPERAALQLSDDDLQLIHAPRRQARPRLALQRRKTGVFPWVPEPCALELRQPVFHLPALADRNSIHPLPHPTQAALPCNWEAEELPEGGWRIRLQLVHDFSRDMHREFLRFANDSCGGQEEGQPGSTLSQAYALSLEMENRHTRQQAMKRYFTLCEDPAFRSFMQRILPEAARFVPLPAEGKVSEEEARQKVASTLATAANRGIFRRELRRALTQHLQQCYEDLRHNNHPAAQGLSLVLSRVDSLPDGTLSWHFKLEQSPSDGETQD